MPRSRTKLIAGTIGVTTILTWLWAMILRELTQRYTRGERPGQFHGRLNVVPAGDYGRVFVIAHNAGDDAETARTALDHGADAVEIDVIMIGGELYAAHAIPPRLIGGWLFSGPKLADAWERASSAAAVALDLKHDSAAFEEILVSFLRQRPHSNVILNSRNIESLIRLGDRIPGAHLYLSVPHRDAFDRQVAFGNLADRLDGVSMQHEHISEDVLATLRARNQRVIAWVVNDLSRVHELIHLGVDGITSDNLAILELLGRRDRPEPFLERRRPKSAPT